MSGTCRATNFHCHFQDFINCLLALTLMSVNFQREFSLVGGGVLFAPVAALGRRTKRSGFISGPDLCVLWICAGIWEAVALQRATWSFLQKPLTFGCFRCLVRWGAGEGCLHPSVPLGHSRKPFGLCSVHTSSSVPEPRTLQRIVHAPGGVADSALVASSLETPVLLLLATCVASTEDSTGEEIWLRSESPGSSPSCVIAYWIEPERDHLAALWLSFSFCGVINN